MRTHRWERAFHLDPESSGELVKVHLPGPDPRRLLGPLLLTQLSSYLRLSCRTPGQVQFAPAGLLLVPLINRHSLGPHSNRWDWMRPFLLIMEPTRPAFQMTLGGFSTESQWQCLPLDKPQSKGSGTCVHRCLEDRCELTCSRAGILKAMSGFRALLSQVTDPGFSDVFPLRGHPPLVTRLCSVYLSSCPLSLLCYGK